MSLSELIGGGGEFSRSTERVRKKLVDAAPESPVIGRTTIGTNMPNIAERIRPNNSESITQAKENETSGGPAQLNDSYTKVVASEPDRVAEEGSRLNGVLPKLAHGTTYDEACQIARAEHRELFQS